jgi:peptide/nickel transport system substrate-binding protein
MKFRKIFMLLLLVITVVAVSACGKEDERWTPTRKYHMFNLATSFAAVYDPYYNDHSRNYNEWQGSNQLRDPFIDYLIEKMRELDPSQRDEYLEYWEEYIVQMNRLMVDIPLYSNMLFDYANTDLWTAVPVYEEVDGEMVLKVDGDGNTVTERADGLTANTPFWQWYHQAGRLRLDYDEDTSSSDNPRYKSGRSYQDDQMVIGSVQMSGDFLPGFGNSSYDVQIRDAVSGYSTIAYTNASDFVVNPTVVKNLEITDYVDGDTTTEAAVYTFEIHDDLYTNIINGTTTDSRGRNTDFDKYHITAKDFVFSVMFTASPAMVAAGSTSAAYNQLLGYQDYKDGETTEFPGIKFISDYKFQVTINPDELPYFYKDAMASISPMPATAYIPDWTVGDVIEEDDAERIADEHLRNPLSTGPYIIDNVNDDLTQVRLIKNDAYKGDWEGIKPEIPAILVYVVPGQTDMDHLINGDVDYLEHVVQPEKVSAAQAESFIVETARERNGYGYLGFHVDMPIIEDYRVRQAIAYAIDRQMFIDEFLGGHGAIVEGPYGNAQWMVQESSRVPNDLIRYTYDLDKAQEMLDAAGWKYGSTNGRTLYDSEKHDVRYNRLGEPLELWWGAQEDSDFTDLLLPILLVGFEEIGIKLGVDYLDWPGLLDNFYYVVNEMEE